MSEDEAFESAPSVQRRRRPMFALAIIAFVAGALAYWYLASAKRAAIEEEAAKSLESLGAIVVMDGSRTHVASVNLSTVTSPASLAKAIELLPALTHLGSLDASRTAITDSQLATIGRLRSLESLALGKTSITDRGLEQLAGLAQLPSEPGDDGSPWENG